jgi:hypothetical protein
VYTKLEISSRRQLPQALPYAITGTQAAADHGRAMIAGPIAPVIPASALAAVGR